nr:MAG TPA: hypothetical protein [Caudoviricetes sp.]
MAILLITEACLLYLVIQNKKEPATETNPQQALGFILYMICPFVINISGVHLHTLPQR